MPYSYSREQIAEYWGWCGEIESLDMLTFPDTGRFRWVKGVKGGWLVSWLAGVLLLMVVV